MPDWVGNRSLEFSLLIIFLFPFLSVSLQQMCLLHLYSMTLFLTDVLHIKDTSHFTGMFSLNMPILTVYQMDVPKGGDEVSTVMGA